MRTLIETVNTLQQCCYALRCTSLIEHEADSAIEYNDDDANWDLMITAGRESKQIIQTLLFQRDELILAINRCLNESNTSPLVELIPESNNLHSIDVLHQDLLPPCAVKFHSIQTPNTVEDLCTELDTSLVYLLSRDYGEMKNPIVEEEKCEVWTVTGNPALWPLFIDLDGTCFAVEIRKVGSHYVFFAECSEK
ncbi:hypothetical protein [Alteromonas antoniana]|uniref:hypothetical protein n=1 Tax=Alteromonas antoniana TaxID=2803813 RepID=UPI001C4603D7|nr:hypothetical protein [Alteromonas antoniana]